ncbi:MAG: hypothetical protein AAFQ82_17340, partial [Myxococcota bacterium]
LSETFQPTNSNDNDTIPDNASPLETGDYGFFVSSTYIPEVGGGGGASDPSRSASTEICFRIDEVNDNGNEGSSTLSGSVRRTGSGSEELTFRDSIASSVDTAVINSDLSALWVKQFAYEAGTTLSPATEAVFVLEQGPRPDGDLEDSFFIETRTVSDWSGFESVTGETFRWFMGPPLSLAGDDFFDNALFDSRPPPPSIVNTFLLTWRETGTSNYPAPLQGPVIHNLRFDFSENGLLNNVREVIVPDQDPSATLDAANAQLVCVNGQPCLQGFLQSDEFSQLFCAF